MIKPVCSAVPTNLITGFLGAGKTTLIQQLLAQKPSHERWAVLVNEFGQIGIDQALMGTSQDIYIKEVAGGCICCANALPMHIALSQLLAKAKPQRVLIEPTGLGHPKQILETLSESHWQTTLALQATLCVIDARQYQDPRVQTHESFLAQAEVADILVFSKNEVLDDAQRASVLDFARQLPPPERQTVFISQGQLDANYLAMPKRPSRQVKRSLLHSLPTALPPVGLVNQDSIEAPYHYHQRALETEVGGWVFPASWQFNHNALLDVLFALTTLRIKGVMHTQEGWLAINLTPLDASLNSTHEAYDSRLEIISEQPIDWSTLERELLNTRLMT
ncbi:CobW family GTP-binding protein [Agitococcus lubricus]|uniref:G3E family GTPase n=1 Tax=Agitococcus lubricus TaxID=1077255 RepID=A0A2T5J240_9GAMM|nr:GTP-binding protein [Agitococcus lubricus]PTQ90413.1 G3E family GTPase [Agitococcus lubricus]